jgi:alkaline phosphatase D
MGNVVRGGTAIALPQNAHAIRVRADGLASDRWYWYQFESGSEVSPVGRTRTFPAPGSLSRLLRFAFVSCQNWESGFFTAWKHLAEEDIDFVIHLGDYIYEEDARSGRVRRHVPMSESATLVDYRNRHAQYRSDPYLQAAHARFPFIATWDDHEVEDNYSGDIPQRNRDADPSNDAATTDFRARRARAYQAYFEHMPLDPRLSRNDANAPIFRSFDWGRLARLHVLDTRQFRSNQPCGGAKDLLEPAGDDLVIACGEELDESATMTGAAQEKWLLDGLKNSPARWNVIAQQAMMASADFGPGAARFDQRFKGAQIRNVDAWDGYVAARNRLLGFVHENAVRNLIVISGDIHCSLVAELKTDFNDPSSPVVGTEFVGTSISSEFHIAFIPVVEAALAAPANAHIKFFDGALHGYVRCLVTPEQWRSDYRVVDTVLLPAAAVHTLKSFTVNDNGAGPLAG